MDSFSSHYKEASTSRGFKYRYYFSTPLSGQPTLLLIHGFPSLAIEWHNQVAHFTDKGYGLVVPDMLGYGGTDKPKDVTAYSQSKIAKDLIDILDHEKVTNVLAVGHDWGSGTTSALAQLYENRFLGFGFLAVGYRTPITSASYEEIFKGSAQAAGREILGYWEFLISPDANEVILKHIESFWDILHAKDPRLWRTNICPEGSMRIFLESDSRTPQLPGFNEELRRIYQEEFSALKGGLEGPLNYYRVSCGPGAEDAKKIPLESYKVAKPVFVGLANHDAVCVSALQAALTTHFCSDSVIHEFKTGHWVATEAPDELNATLDSWITTIIS